MTQSKVETMKSGCLVACAVFVMGSSLMADDTLKVLVDFSGADAIKE